jgi:phage gp46-like protein
MRDVALNFIDGEYDIVITENDLESDDGLETAVSISLFSDRRVTDDELPFDEKSKRGWWADMFSDINGDKIGSRLWTMDRSKILPETLRKSEDYCRESLKWLIDDGIADSINVISEYNESKAMITRIQIVKPAGISPRFSVFWDAQELRRE